jgi:acyl-CoA thioesterase FadM
MNLYLRLLWTILRCWRLPRISLDTVLERELRVLPNDVDINLHMNNGRYMTVVDLLLIEYFVRTGYASLLLKNGWKPMSGGSIITFRRGLAPLKRYTVKFSYAASDEFWNFMRFEFHANGKLAAAGYMKGAAVSAQGLVPNATSFAQLSAVPQTTEIPEAVRHWMLAERCVIDANAAPV